MTSPRPPTPRLRELNEKTKHEFLVAKKSKDMIREMIEKYKAKKDQGKRNEKMQEYYKLMEMARRLNILTRKVATIPYLPKEAPTTKVAPIPQS